jgi:hypothetical protein
MEKAITVVWTSAATAGCFNKRMLGIPVFQLVEI